MKNNLLLIALSIILLSCNSGSGVKTKTEVKPDTISVSQSNKNADSTDKRESIISELNKFSDAVAKKDKATILSFFNFPLADSSVNFFEVDSVFDAKRKLNNGITKEMFAHSFNTIYQQTDMTELNNLFKNLNTNDLHVKDKIDFTHKLYDDGCYYLYSIQINNDEVLISYGTNSNDDYRKAHPDEEEVCDEYAQMWIFRFDGNKLKFIKHRIAG